MLCVLLLQVSELEEVISGLKQENTALQSQLTYVHCIYSVPYMPVHRIMVALKKEILQELKRILHEYFYVNNLK